MDSKIMSIRFNEFNLEFLALLKQHVNGKDTIKLNDSDVVKYAIQRCLLYEALDLGTGSELYKKYKDLDTAYTKHLLGH